MVVGIKQDVSLHDVKLKSTDTLQVGRSTFYKSKGYLAKTVKHTGIFNSGTALGNNSYKTGDTSVNLNKTIFLWSKNVKKMTLK